MALNTTLPPTTNPVRTLRDALQTLQLALDLLVAENAQLKRELSEGAQEGTRSAMTTPSMM